eukprot:1688162-Amphidinium_carterae.1
MEVKADLRAECIAAILTGAYTLKFASQACKRDREIVLAAVEKDGRDLLYASEDCKSNQEIVLAA